MQWVMPLWRDPRRSRLRRLTLALHLWLGVGLGIYAAVIGLSGSALVFLPELQQAAHPAWFRTGSPGRGDATLATLITRIHTLYPGQPVLGIDALDTPQKPAVVYVDDHGRQRTVYADQASGAILAAPLRYQGLLGRCAELHVYLLGGSVGYLVNGLCGAGFTVLCLSGLLLWWPGAGRVRRGLRVHRGAGARRRVWELHTVGGFWASGLLLAVAATGVLFIFPKPVLTGLAWLSGSRAGAAAWLAAPPAAARLANEQPLSPDAALLRAEAVLQARGEGNYSVHYLALPVSANGVYDAIAYPRGGPDYALPVYLYLDGATGALLRAVDARAQPFGIRIATYAYALHFGTMGGLAMRVLWVLLGLAPAALWVTGLLVWWNRGLRRRLVLAATGAATGAAAG